MRRDYKRIALPTKAYWPIAGVLLAIAVVTVFLMAARF